MLEVEEIDVFYGKLQIIHKLSFKVNTNQITTIIGSNGAGKTTLLRAVSGFVHASGGRVIYNGICIKDMKPWQIARIGICIIDEAVKIFPYMTVTENLIIGSYRKEAWSERNRLLKEIFDLFPQLFERRKQQALNLSGGERRMLGIGRGLMSNPDLIMLDEPSSGLAPKMVEGMFNIILEINRVGKSVLLVEQNVWGSLNHANYGYVIENGRNIIQGNGKELLGNSLVKKAYLWH